MILENILISFIFFIFAEGYQHKTGDKNEYQVFSGDAKKVSASFAVGEDSYVLVSAYGENVFLSVPSNALTILVSQDNFMLVNISQPGSYTATATANYPVIVLEALSTPSHSNSDSVPANVEYDKEAKKVLSYETGKTLLVTNGSSVTLSCPLETNDDNNITWTKVLDDTMDIVGTGQEIDVVGEELNKNYEYTCQNSFDKYQFTLEIVSAPFFEEEVREIIYVGEDQISICEIDETIKPKPNVIWYENSGNSLTKINTTKGELKISKWGIFECHINNSFGHAVKTVKVNLQGCLYKKTWWLKDTIPMLDDNREIENKKDWYFIQKDKKIKLFCSHPEENSFVRFPKKSMIEATCMSEHLFEIDGSSYELLSDLNCNKKNIPIILPNNKPCFSSNNNSKSVSVVYTSEASYISIYEVCYDGSEKTLLYVKYRTDFHNNTERKDKFDSCSKRTSKFVNLDYEPLISYLETENIKIEVPQWYGCNRKMEWYELEETIYSLESVTQVWSGYSNAYIYSTEETIPQYFWMVVQNKISSQKNVIVYVNEPYIKSNVSAEQYETFYCNDTCEGITMEVSKRSFCCTLENFIQKFHIPKDTFEVKISPLSPEEQPTTAMLPTKSTLPEKDEKPTTAMLPTKSTLPEKDEKPATAMLPTKSTLPEKEQPIT